MTENKLKKPPYGFIIYRGDYTDDAKWERYMAYLKHQARHGLESECVPQLYDRMDWKVIVKTSLGPYFLVVLSAVLRYRLRSLSQILKCKTMNQRLPAGKVSESYSALWVLIGSFRRFNEWLQSGEEEFNSMTIRHRACILVNSCYLDIVDEFLKKKALDWDGDHADLIDIYGCTAAILVSRFKEEGWAMISMSCLIPKAGWAIVQGWEQVAIEEGEIKCL